MGPEIPKEKSNESEINIFCGPSVDEGGTSFGNGSEGGKEFKNDLLVKKVVDHWKLLAFTSQKRLSSTSTEIEKSEEVDEGLPDNIHLIVNMDSDISKDETTSSTRHNEPDDAAKDPIIMESITDCESSADNNPQTEKIFRRRNSAVINVKRKLSSRRTKELDESNESSRKRSRGEPKKMRSLSRNTLPHNNFEEDSNKKNRRKSSDKVGNSSFDHYEYETEDSDVNTEKKSERNDAKSEDTNQASISPRKLHHNKILKMLNEGSIAELKSLPRIGPKAATMIHQHR